MYAVIGTSAFSDITVAVGPFRSTGVASDAWDELTHRGWNAEMVTLDRLGDIPYVTNEENA